MSARARVVVDTGKIEQNARRVVEALAVRGVAVVGVTKVTAGTPEVARAMLAGGVVALGESRLENVERLRAAGIDAQVWLLRAPTPDLADDAVRLTQVSLESEVSVVAALEIAAACAGTRHSIVAMVDIGDLREGMMPDDLPAFLETVSMLEHIGVLGLGASLTCYGAILPDAANLGLLGRLAETARARLGRALAVSGGSSTSIAPVLAGLAPAAIDNLRIGEAIVLGVDPATRAPIPGLDLHTDAIVVEAPVIECMVKPSKPTGICMQDAFGNVPVFEDRGMRRRAICALGRQDTPAEGLRPLDPRVEVLGASSDHLVLDVDALPQAPAIGEAIAFVPGYSATLALFTSPYVEKRFI
jgi:predicted amino acid racemase